MSDNLSALEHESYHRNNCNPSSPSLVRDNFIPDTTSNLPQDLIDMLKPIVEACGMTQLNQLPQMGAQTTLNNRMAFLEECIAHNEINLHLSFDQTVHLESEYRLVKNYLSLLDKNNTIDTPSKWVSDWNKHKAAVPIKKLREIFKFPKAKAEQDDISRMLAERTIKSRGTVIEQRVKNEIRLASERGWFISFDTLTLADDKIECFNSDAHALRDYFRAVSRKILRAEGWTNKQLKSARSSDINQCYRYICIPEFGTDNGRLHWHAIHLMRNLPKGTEDPNYGRRNPNYLMLKTLHNTWKYGFNAPIQVRYSGDAYTKAGWKWPTDKDGVKRKASQPINIAVYITKYITKKVGQDLIRKNPKGNLWNKQLQTQMKILGKTHFRVRMNRGFGMELPSMGNLELATLCEITKLHWSVTPIASLLKQKAKRELRSRLAILSVNDIQTLMPETLNLLKFLRDLTRTNVEFNLANFMNTLTQKLTLADVSKETCDYVFQNKLDTATMCPRFKGGSSSK